MVRAGLHVFDASLGPGPHQLGVSRDDVVVTPQELLEVQVEGGTVSESGLRSNVEIAIRYLESWLNGVGAAAIHNLMEDAATAEISRSQVWQWIRHATRLSEGALVTRELVAAVTQEETDRIRNEGATDRLDEASELFRTVVLDEAFEEFITIPAYERLP